jgi:hypothetical protein
MRLVNPENYDPTAVGVLVVALPSRAHVGKYSGDLEKSGIQAHSEEYKKARLQRRITALLGERTRRLYEIGRQLIETLGWKMASWTASICVREHRIRVENGFVNCPRCGEMPSCREDEYGCVAGCGECGVLVSSGDPQMLRVIWNQLQHQRQDAR